MRLPLSGLRIVVTRAIHQADELAQPLREQGATPVLLPVIGIAPPSDPEPLRQALGRIESYDWIIFTSTNAVRAVGTQRTQARVATVGAATRQFAEQLGWKVEVTPETYVAEALVEALGTHEIKGKRILIPTAAVTREVVPTTLMARGGLVEVVEAYRNIIPPEAADQAKELFRLPFPDWITFASSSAVDNLVNLVGTESIRQSKIACIGPLTGKTARAYGLRIDTEPAQHTIPGLVNAIVHAVSPNTA